MSLIVTLRDCRSSYWVGKRLILMSILDHTCWNWWGWNSFWGSTKVSSIAYTCHIFPQMITHLLILNTIISSGVLNGAHLHHIDKIQTWSFLDPVLASSVERTTKETIAQVPLSHCKFDHDLKIYKINLQIIVISWNLPSPSFFRYSLTSFLLSVRQ